ncbi:MAG TPA: hypothetical protein VKA84_19920 [Gemmatimonadaceae bacterium]|nr:hypothetical protein [Gemmatimonadaceae bacterium]
MSDRNWDKELSKIDKQLESVSDEALFPTKGAPTPAAKAQTSAVQQSTRTWGAFARLALAVLLGVAMLFWPYSARCGPGLAAYLGAVAAVVGGGIWSAVWTWRHRTSRAHTLSLLIVLWGLVLAALEVLPRVGYAKPDMNHPAIWSCE